MSLEKKYRHQQRRQKNRLTKRIANMAIKNFLAVKTGSKRNPDQTKCAKQRHPQTDVKKQKTQCLRRSWVYIKQNQKPGQPRNYRAEAHYQNEGLKTHISQLYQAANFNNNYFTHFGINFPDKIRLFQTNLLGVNVI